jgi:hypothetical protein
MGRISALPTTTTPLNFGRFGRIESAMRPLELDGARH